MKKAPAKTFAEDKRPIGVFDSGVGGLTVLRALQAAMPGEAFIYLGDTARVPYGTKSADTVRTYSLGLAGILLAEDVKMIVIACNTASAHATQAVAELAAPIPVIGMIEPAAAAAVKVTRNKNILIMATQSTTRTASYANAIKAIAPDVQVRGVATQVLVAMAEEGWTDNDVARAAIRQYIGSYFADGVVNKPDTVILGCTHFPLLRDMVAEVAGPGVSLIDSGGAAAVHIVENWPARRGPASDARFLVTDAVAQFKPLAERFLRLPVLDITHIDLTNFSTPATKEKKYV